MIAIKRGNGTISLSYVTVHGNTFALKGISKSAFTKQYRILEKYVPEGIYRNEILDVLASLFAINTRDEKLVDMVLEGSKAEIAKLQLNMR